MILLKISRYFRENRVINLFEVDCIQTLSHLDFGVYTHSVNNMLSIFYDDNKDINLLSSPYNEWHLYIIRNKTSGNKFVYNIYYADNKASEVKYND